MNSSESLKKFVSENAEEIMGVLERRAEVDEILSLPTCKGCGFTFSNFTFKFYKKCPNCNLVFKEVKPCL